MSGALNGLPINQERDRVFGLWDTVVRLAGCYSRGGTRDDARGIRFIGEHPAAYINVVAGEIVRNIRVSAGPRAERLQLRLWLGHPCGEKVEFAERVGACFCVAICRVESAESGERSCGAGDGGGRRDAGGSPLVVLYEHDDVVLSGLVDEVLVVREQLRCGLGDEDVEAALDGVYRDRVVRACADGDMSVDADGSVKKAALSGVKTITASPGDSWSMARLSACTDRCQCHGASDVLETDRPQDRMRRLPGSS